MNTVYPVPPYLEVHRTPLWNVPLPPRFEAGAAVTSAATGKRGEVVCIIPAPATSALRSRPHAYGVRFDGDPVTVFENELS